MKKRLFFITACICLIMCIIFSVPTVSAVEIKKGIIEVATVDGNVGDEVIVPIKIKENPGIMAVTISVTYDSSALEYVSFYYGGVFNDYTVADHPTRNLIRLVICETRDKKTDGKVISFKFKIKSNAKAELTKIGIDYKLGDFCNWNLDKIMPQVVSGGVNVAFNGQNCPHKEYGDWTVVTEPVCSNVGVSERVCKLCGHKELKEIPAIGHTYSDKWTVDKPATAEKEGTMSRYCIRCDSFVDRVTFSLEQTKNENIKNEFWADVEDNKVAEQLFAEQNPGSKPTENSDPENTESKETPAEDTTGTTEEDDSTPLKKDKSLFGKSNKIVKIAVITAFTVVALAIAAVLIFVFKRPKK